MNINGITEIEKFLTCIAEMYLMVVSEKIINDIPEKRSQILILYTLNSLLMIMLIKVTQELIMECKKV